MKSVEDAIFEEKIGDTKGPPDGIYSVNYRPPPTLLKFHRSSAFVRGVMGPVGSGKSTACCFEIFRRAAEQKPGYDGIRRTRWAVIRNTYPELETTTIKTWLYWFPENIFGKFYKRVPYRHDLKFNDVEAEIYFIALDSADDVKKLLSLELTGVWINEAREVPIEILRGCTDRVGRFPAKRDGGPTWCGVIMDTNAPNEEHWWPILAGDVPLPLDWQPVDDWGFWTQPPAAFEKKVGGRTVWEDNPNAENLENLPDGYYANGRSGKTNAHIRVYQGCKYGNPGEGKGIYDEEWSEEIHLSPIPLVTIPHRLIIAGLDFGRTPSAVFSQLTPRGTWHDLYEVVCEDMGAERFAKLLKLEVTQQFPTNPVQWFGDPSGAHNLQSDERSYFDILRANGIRVFPAPSQTWTIRREAGARPLERNIDGGPGYQIDGKKCPVLLAGFRGKFCYKPVRSGGVVIYTDNVEKNKWSHPHEARQYGYCGGGEAADLVGKETDQKKRPKSFKAKTGFNVFEKR